VTQVSVSLARDAATVEYRADHVTPKDMVQAVHRVVVFPGVRRSLERAARSSRRGKA
jgi:hypothetical protein